MGGKRSGLAVWLVGSLAAVTCIAGVTAAVASPGSSGSQHASAAAASPATVAVAEATTTTSTTVPPAPATSLPRTTTTTVAPRPVPTTTVALEGSINGRVTHTNGEPVAGARVTLAGAREGTVATDDAGRYAFGDLPAGAYDLSVLAESPAAPCQPPQPCIGSAIAVQRRPVVLRAGESHTEDWVYPYDSPPSYS